MAEKPKFTMKKRVKGYWHILLINHFEEIIQEQLTCFLNSGLYDASENIFIGALGENKEFYILSDIVRKYPKFIIAEYSRNKEMFEFHTLNILKEHSHQAKEDYYLFYVHGKGVSFPKEINEVAYHGGGHWRRHMNEYTINRWKENVAELDKGYETCGTQLRPFREWKEHYSGNFFWATSEYIRLLKPVYALNIKDRFLAETYICSAHPISATLSQEFVDYYNPKQEDKPITVHFTPMPISPAPYVNKQVKQGRNVVGTLCWAIYDDVERAVDSLYSLNDPNDFEHIIADLSFPLEKADEVPDNIEEAIKRNSAKLKALAEKYGSKYVQMKNEGVSGNWSSIWREEKLVDGDALITCDPDEFVHPQAYNWVKIMGDLIRSKEKYGVVSLIMEEQFDSLTPNNSREREVNGNRVIDVKGEAMWACAAMSAELLNKIGGVPHPQDWKIYGWLESALISAMAKYDYKWCFTADLLVSHPEPDSTHLLRRWKDDITSGQFSGKAQIHFEEWLKKKQLVK